MPPGRNQQQVTRKGVKGREPASAIERAARAVIKAAGGDVREALRYLIQRHWKSGEALRWLKEKVGAEQNRVGA
jgi:hypothetical protein